MAGLKIEGPRTVYQMRGEAKHFILYKRVIDVKYQVGKKAKYGMQDKNYAIGFVTCILVQVFEIHIFIN